MSRRSLRPWLWTVTLVPLWAATASASSITCYGSIVLSTLGTEGMAVTIPDGSVTQPAAPISAGGATIGSDPSGAGISSPGAAAAPAATPRSSGGGGGGGTSQKPPTAAQGVPDSSTASPVIAPPPSDNSSSPPVVTDTKPEIVETVPPPPIQTAVPPSVTTPVPLSSEGTVEIVPISASDNTVTPAPSDQAPPVDSPEPATLTLLGLAGLGGLVRLRRRK